MRLDLIAAILTLAALAAADTARADPLPKEPTTQEKPPIKPSQQHDRAAQTGGEAPQPPPLSKTPVLKPKPKPPK
jgi:hypothetical protein